MEIQGNTGRPSRYLMYLYTDLCMYVSSGASVRCNIGRPPWLIIGSEAGIMGRRRQSRMKEMTVEHHEHLYIFGKIGWRRLTHTQRQLTQKGIKTHPPSKEPR